MHVTEDPEIAALSQISAALAPLDEDARSRVIRWIASKYNQMAVTPVAKPLLASDNAAVASEGRSLAELYAATDPRTDAEKVLVVGYFFQHVEGLADLDAQRINTELKHLGHVIGNITRAFSYLIQRRPQLAIQIRKSGSTKQARKRFRITGEGAKAVQQMMTGQRLED